jgi:hypothetical protein
VPGSRPWAYTAGGEAASAGARIWPLKQNKVNVGLGKAGAITRDGAGSWAYNVGGAGFSRSELLRENQIVARLVKSMLYRELCIRDRGPGAQKVSARRKSKYQREDSSFL